MSKATPLLCVLVLAGVVVVTALNQTPDTPKPTKPDAKPAPAPPPVVVTLYWQPGCVPCEEQKGILMPLKATNNGVEWKEQNVRQQPEPSVHATPALILTAGSRKKRFDGVTGASEIQRAIDELRK